MIFNQCPTSSYLGFQLYTVNSTPKLYCDVRNTATSSWVSLVSTTTIVADTWYHAVFLRDSGTFKMFVNGTMEDSDAGGNFDIDFSSSPVWIGRNAYGNGGGAQYHFNGNIDEYRITKAARYASNFTPSATQSLDFCNKKRY